MEGRAEVVEIALETGFDLAGIAPLRPPPGADAFRRWLEAGHQAGMDWLERDRERIADPRTVFPPGRSLLVVGLGHGRAPVELPGGGRVARYAAGRDYHNRVGKLLGKLARRLQAAGWISRSRAIVDAGPLLERSHAAEAGLGFESKAANLLNARFGPWFFLGELLVDAELDPTPHPAPGSCGTCTACIDACPTAAIVAEGVVDANLCLSYHTIENRGPIPHELRPALGDWAFGCDVCSEVCPWGSDAPDASADWGTHARVGGEGAGLVDWLRTPPASYAERFRGSPLQRARREGLARNAALVLGNLPANEGAARALRAALAEDPSALVREAAAWALARAYGDEAGTRAAVERARSREPDAQAARGMALALGGVAQDGRAPATSMQRDTDPPHPHGEA